MHGAHLTMNRMAHHAPLHNVGRRTLNVRVTKGQCQAHCMHGKSASKQYMCGSAPVAGGMRGSGERPELWASPSEAACAALVLGCGTEGATLRLKASDGAAGSGSGLQGTLALLSPLKHMHNKR